ncbi:SCO family protein [Pseudomonas sp. gcc21]|uniref:SCO family protein n=1 Tax=Pseudomonas sp. gcc21 TaxID=2726989 RepID=UPI001451BC41|nr:SCO family protein [Pseudomonas sp. gcc21]QJD57503.1 SCO family protein [Pseudomonas sp. gcc21]
MNKTLIACGLGILLLAAGLPVAYLSWPARTSASVAIAEGAAIGGPFELRDPTGRTITEQTFRGQWTLMFFGFTHCPDICPTTLTRVAAILRTLDQQAGQLQPLFITLDPERDTPEILSDYTRHFDPRILGLTGTPEQIDAISDAYRVYARKVPMGDAYTLDHSAVMYLIGPDGELVKHFTQQMDTDAMAREIADALPRSAGDHQ